MKLFELSLPGMVVRFYLMMTVVLIAGFTGVWAIALLALPIFLSAMIGMTGNKEAIAKPEPNTTTELSVGNRVVLTKVSQQLPPAAA